MRCFRARSKTEKKKGQIPPSSVFCLVAVVQSLSNVQLFVTPWTAALQAFLSFTISRSLLKLLSIESVMPSNHLILCWPLLLLPSIFPSIRVFSNESVLCIRWPKYWSFSFSISPSSEYSRLVSFRIEWFDLLAGQGALKSPPAQFESINSSELSLLYGPRLFMALVSAQSFALWLLNILMVPKSNQQKNVYLMKSN